MTEILATAALEQLSEHIRDWHAEDLDIDRAERLVRNVALTAANSKNGYRYSEQALQSAVSLYENKPVFLDHAANIARPYERSTRDLAGSIVAARFLQGRIRGDIRLLDTEAGRTLLALAETKNPAAGMSHVVLAERSSDHSIVEKIHEVISIDAVVFPATASTFQEKARDPHSAADADDESLRQRIDELEQNLGAVNAERDALRAELDRFQTAEQRAALERQVDDLLEESQLNPCAYTDLFRQQLLAAADEAARRTLIRERLSVLEQFSRQSPSSRERLVSTAAGLSDDDVIAAIRPARLSVFAGAA